MTDESGAAKERVEDHLIRHTRMIPRDVISLGNALAREILRHRKAGRDRLPDAALRDVVARCAKRYRATSSLAQCADPISSDLMPSTAGRYEFTGVYTGDQAYISGVVDQMRSLIRLMKVDQFPPVRPGRAARDRQPLLRERDRRRLGALAERSAGLRRRSRLQEAYYTLGDVEEFQLPSDVEIYVLHPCLVSSVGLSMGPGRREPATDR